MKFESEKNKDLDWLKQPMSDDFKKKVLNAARFELDINKANTRLNTSKNYNWVWTFAISFALVAMVTIRFSGQIDLNTPTTTFDDLALLTPEEIELVENLDVLEKMDAINLEKIRQEMKKRGNKS
jgi:hypothetical protein